MASVVGGMGLPEFDQDLLLSFRPAESILISF